MTVIISCFHKNSFVQLTEPRKHGGSKEVFNLAQYERILDRTRYDTSSTLPLTLPLAVRSCTVHRGMAVKYSQLLVAIDPTFERSRILGSQSPWILDSPWRDFLFVPTLLADQMYRLNGAADFRLDCWTVGLLASVFELEGGGVDFSGPSNGDISSHRRCLFTFRGTFFVCAYCDGCNFSLSLFSSSGYAIWRRERPTVQQPRWWYIWWPEQRRMASTLQEATAFLLKS